jgi:hypothetical protein
MPDRNVIVGHIGVDHDAAYSLWLLATYGGFADCRIAFVDAREPDQYLLNRAAAVVDVGLVWNEAERRFDHHGPDVAQRPDTCAATLVIDWLARAGVDLSHLKPLTDLVMALDTGKETTEAHVSDALGIHAALRGLSRAGIANDEQLTRLCFALYTGLDAELKRRRDALAALEASTQYKSACGRFWVVAGKDRTVADMAGEAGAEVVLFAYTHEVEQPKELELGGIPMEPDTKTSYAVAVRRTDRLCPAPDLGAAVGRALQLMGRDARRNRGRGDCTEEIEAARAELGSWFIHPQGYYAGRGIEAAPNYTPVSADLLLIGSYLEQAIWQLRPKPLRRAALMQPSLARFAPVIAAVWAAMLLPVVRLCLSAALFTPILLAFYQTP